MRAKIWILLVALVAIAAVQMRSYGQQPYAWPAQAYQQASPYVGYLPQQAGLVGGMPGNVILTACQEPAGRDCGCAVANGGGNCSDGSCGGSSYGCCALPQWIVYGEALYMRPRNVQVAYGVPFNGPATSPPDTPIQIAPVGICDFDYQPAFRVGFMGAIGDCGMVGVSYMKFESTADNAITTQPGLEIRSMVVHPSTLTTAGDWLDASSRSALDFDIIDLEVRRVFSWSELHTLNWVAGLRYTNLYQESRSLFEVLGSQTVVSDVRFDGAGLRFGLEGERYARNNGLVGYARANISFVAGQFRADYAQGQAYDASVVNTVWRGGRTLVIGDVELGVGWTSPGGGLRLTGGYMFSGWYNAVTPADFIQSVQENDFVGLGDRLSFDGLVGRVEGRF